MMMKKKNTTYRLIVPALVAACLAGCAAGRQAPRPLAMDPARPRTFEADGQARAAVDVTFRVPAHYFSKRSRLVIAPYVTDGSRVVEELEPVVLDAPVYVKKSLRQKALDDGYADALAPLARPVKSVAEGFVLPYTATVALPRGVDSLGVKAMVSEDGCGECSGLDTLDVATVVRGLLPLRWMEPRFEVVPKVVRGSGEARLQFVINKYDIRLDMGHNREELYGMVRKLEPVLKDSLATVETFDIYGMASADGPLSFNTPLSRNRALSAKRWLMEQLNVPDDVARRISVGSRPEGWGSVLEAMTRDGHPDSVAVKEILERHAGENDDVAERYIRRLPCWPDIRENYLQKDRKVEYAYTYVIRNFTTDDELLAMYASRPDAFNEQELLRVAALVATDQEKMDVYRFILGRFPACETAANNLAYLLVAQGRKDEARPWVARLPERYPDAAEKRLTTEERP